MVPAAVVVGQVDDEPAIFKHLAHADLHNLDRMRVLPAVVVAGRFPEQPEVGMRVFAVGVEMWADPRDKEAVHEFPEEPLPVLAENHHPAAALVEEPEQPLYPHLFLFDEFFHRITSSIFRPSGNTVMPRFAKLFKTRLRSEAFSVTMYSMLSNSVTEYLKMVSLPDLPANCFHSVGRAPRRLLT